MSDRKVKTYKDFMGSEKPSYFRMLNQMVIEGEYKPGFLSKKRKFEMIVYYTPMKGKIMDIVTNMDSYFYEFRQGSNISEVSDWVKKNGYTITMNKKKI